MGGEGSGTGLRVLVVVMVVVGALFISLGAVFFWADRTLLREEGIASLADDLLAREEVQAAMAEVILDRTLEDAPPLAQLARPLLREVIAGLVATDAFSNLLSGSLRRSYGLLLNAEAPELVLELPDALSQIKERVARLDAELAAAIPDGSRLEAVAVTSQAVVRPIRMIDQTATIAAWVLFLLGLGLVAGGVYLGRPRSWAGTIAGAALAGWTALIAVTLLIIKMIVVAGIVNPLNAAAAEAAWEVLFRGVQISMLVVALIGVLIILFSRLYAGEERPTSIRDLGTRPIAAVLLVLGVLLVVGPRPGAGLLALLIGLALLAAGLVWLFPGLTGSTRSRQSAPASESGDGPPGPSGSEVGSEPSPHD